MNIVDRLRQPEHTGANRCRPCTAVNVAIAVVLAIGVGVAWPTAGGPLAAGLVFALALGTVWLRGYLVPGTPTLTKRYFPDRLLALFGKAPDDATERDRADVDPERVLLEAGVVEPAGDDLRLEARFRTAWTDRMAELAAEDEQFHAALADRLDVAPASLEVVERDPGVAAVADGYTVGSWPSRAAVVADLAAAPLLADRVADWAALGADAKSAVLAGVRGFVETCPTCGGPVTPGTERVESCCTTREVIAVTCGDCTARLLEVPAPPDAAASPA